MAVAEARQILPMAEGKPNALLGMTRLPVIKQAGLLIGLAASVALGIAIVSWSQTPGYNLLYGALTTQGAAEVIAALDAVNIPYRLDEKSGAMLVPSGKVHEARLKLAAQGLPRSTSMGFEILEKEQGFGTSQFIERARYQRALEVELARTIGNLNHVQNARVHLAVPKQSVFVRNRKKPSASILAHLYSGRTLKEEQVAAITHLVAASVPNMEASDVKVVDHKGRMLTAPEQSREALLSRGQFDYTRRVEADFVKRIEDILAPVVGEEGVRAQVAADMDFTHTEQTRETYNPDLPALRSEQIIEEQGLGTGAAGIPGALSNQPPGVATAPEQARAGDSGGATKPETNSGRRRATRNYELDKTISHTVMPAVSVRRLSVAVVVDDHLVPGEDGAITRTSLTPEEINRITGLVKEAVGYDAQRGDSVNVTNAPFTVPVPPEPLPEVPLWEQQWVWDLAKQALGVLLVLFLMLGVLRPAMRRLTAHEVVVREQQAARLEAPGKGVGELGEDQLSISNADGDVAKLAASQTRENPVNTVKTVIGDDPKRVAQVVRSWVNEDE